MSPRGDRTSPSFDDDISLTMTERSDKTSKTTGTGIVNKSGSRPQYIDPKVAEKEQRFVNISKWGMIICLMIVAAAFCTATYLILVDQEQQDFQKQFENDASEIIAVSKEHVSSAFTAIEAFANSISSYAKDAGESWPNVTVPDFTSRATRVAKLAQGARLVTMAPIVEASEREQFEEFARNNIHEQIQEDLDYQGIDMNATDLVNVPDRISYFNLSAKAKFLEPEGAGPFLVNWQRMPFEVEPHRIFVMNNMLRIPTIRGAVTGANITKGAKAAFFEAILGVESQIIQPIFEDVIAPHDKTTASKKMVAAVWIVMDWGNYFKNLLPENTKGIYLVLESSCGFKSTYEINGLDAEFLGLEDLHETEYDDLEISSEFFTFATDDEEDEKDQTELPEGVCIDQLTIKLYPSAVLEDASTTNKPLYFTLIVGAIFVFTCLVFLMYDCAVGRRQRKVMARVKTQDKIVSNLFPATIRDRLYGIGDRQQGHSGGGSSINSSSYGNASQKDLMLGDDTPDFYGSKPLAELYLDTTVLFADISGFTAWSSQREPFQVFSLLEKIYGAFDKLAHRYGIFKVETIGDCYVAVAGLPEPRKDHAVAMAKFARECMDKMAILTQKLEVSLGPDTEDLELRMGLHSGQVTAGVLRGERSRFQLFGDTVNTASRMESTGIKSRIQISNVTAALLKEQGRSKWVHERETKISVHGKGMMQTYWLETKKQSDDRNNEIYKQFVLSASEHNKDNNPTTKTIESFDTADNTDAEDDSWGDEDDEILGSSGVQMTKKQRLVEWNVEILSDLLKRIIAARGSKKVKEVPRAERRISGRDTTVLEEFEEIIELPKISMEQLRKRKDPDYVMLDPKVVSQLRDLISKIADMYQENDFHNFEHASHVTASVAKLLSRIVTVDTTKQTSGPSDLKSDDIAGHSYGITNDPLTQFAVVFSAIVHDADHPGVPNAQLVKEKIPIAARYKEKSVAEQNSVDLVWELMMEPAYSDLRCCIYADEVELKRFRQLVVNVVMATDIADKELGALRKARWAKAFSEDNVDANEDLAINRKATIVIEHLIQASDVSHTMQHWQVYKKWNERFFFECYKAYKEGRADNDPSLGWYKGEIGFFDFYIIPLAKKLDSCGVFGVSSHEYLNYAEVNKDEWMRKGESIVEEYIAAYEARHKRGSPQKSVRWGQEYEA